MSKVQLLLANTSGVFHPGDKINGTILCNFNSKKTVRAIKVRLTGKEQTHWVERETYYDHQEKKDITRDVTYTGENVFLDKEYKMIENETILPPGIHDYPFLFTLPQDIPSTFDTSNGNVQYKIKVVVDRLWNTDYKDSVYLKMISPLDLNEIRELNNPYEMSDEKYMCCCCCKSGPLTMTVNLPRRAYAPGEIIYFSVHIENLSDVSVRSLKFTLAEDTELTANNPRSHSKVATRYIGEITERGVDAHSDYVFPLSIKIRRNIAPANCSNCQLFKSSYYMKCKAVCPSPHTNLSFDISLMIGHLGIRGSNTFAQPPRSIALEYPIRAPAPYQNSMPPAEAPYPTGTLCPSRSAEVPYPPSFSETSSYGFSTEPGPSAPPKNDASEDDFDNPKSLEANADAEPPSAQFLTPPSYDEALNNE